MRREQRRRQLLDVGWEIVRQQGTGALTLGYLAEQADVTKPVVYSHFETREWLLAALYEEFDAHQNEFFDAVLAVSTASLESRAQVIAQVYVECMAEQRQEISEVIAALAGSPELARVRRKAEDLFVEKCMDMLSPFAGQRGLGIAGFWALVGAGQVLTREMAMGSLTAEEVQEELLQMILTLVQRSQQH
jgi:AcrR family transcriptional regulator